jgi:hypothetical protein
MPKYVALTLTCNLLTSQRVSVWCCSPQCRHEFGEKYIAGRDSGSRQFVEILTRCQLNAKPRTSTLHSSEEVLPAWMRYLPWTISGSNEGRPTNTKSHCKSAVWFARLPSSQSVDGSACQQYLLQVQGRIVHLARSFFDSRINRWCHELRSTGLHSHRYSIIDTD